MNSILNLIIQNYKKQPDSISVVDKDGYFTFKDLFNFANKIASKLQSEGICKQDCVSIELASGKEFIASIIACQILGVVYVPLGNSHPDKRVDYIRNDCQVKVVIDEFFLKDLNSFDSYEIEPVKKLDSEVEMIIYTSGTTGHPKGVVHTVKSLYRAITGMHNNFTNPSANDVFANAAPLNFILGIQCCLGCLSFYAKYFKLIICSPSSFSNSSDFVKFLNKWQANKIAMSSELLPIIKNNKTCLKKIFIGGGSVSNVYAKNINIYNSYGSSELGGGCTFFLIDKNYRYTPIGDFFSGLNYYILDEKNNKTDEGELCISGVFALGYLNDEPKTKRIFVNNPFYKIDKHKMLYKTGDIAKIDKDGNISIVGRKDLMVKINGQRVELEEIEYNLMQIDGIHNAVVQYRAEKECRYLVAFYESNKKIDSKIIIKELSSHLEHYMIPNYFIKVNKFPLLSNGKVNRMGLSNYNINTNNKNYVEPKNKTEKIVCNAFSKVLNINQVGVNDDFIMLGGDSVDAIQLLDYLDNYSLSATDILNYKTPKLISKNIGEKKGFSLTSKQYDIKKGIPLSEQQLIIYLDIVTNDKNEAYLIPCRTNFKTYSVQDVAIALNSLFRIHPILKCYIEKKEGSPFIVQGGNPDICIESNVTTNKLNKFLTSPFSLDKSLCRFMIDKNNHVLYAVFSHIIFDGLSSVVYSRDLFRILKNEKIEKETVFTNCFALSREIKKTGYYKKAKMFFEKEFSEEDDIIMPIPDFDCGDKYFFKYRLKIDNNKINDFIKIQNITKSVLFTSAFAYMLSRFTNLDKSYFSVIENGRSRYKNSTDAIGVFVNTVPILIDCKDTTIERFINKAKDKIFKTINYSLYPFRLLKKEYNLNNDISFQFFPKKSNIELINTKVYESEQRKDLISKLFFDVYDDDEYIIDVTTNGVYSPHTVRQMIYVFEKILNGILEKKYLREINYVLDNDIKIIEKFNKTSLKLKYKDILEAFNYSVKKYPQNVLVSCNDIEYTYSEALNWINCVSSKLSNIPQGSNIAIFTSRSIFYVIGALAVLNCGCSYVPIDDSYPDERIKFVLKDSNAECVIVTDDTKKRASKLTNSLLLNVNNLDIHYVNKSLNTNFKDTSNAVILYTSGTTGVPKGVVLPRRAILNFAEWCAKEMKFNNADCFAMYCSFAFDVHIEAFFTPLITGGEITIVPEEIRTNIIKLIDYLESKNVTHIELSTAFTKLLFTYKIPKTLKVLLTGGEVLGDFYKETDCLFYDTYGPTEATVSVSYIKVKDKINQSSIGSLTANTKAYILDKENRQVPVGAIGELYLSGYQLANGYLNRKKENSKSFFKNPYDCQKYGYEIIYKTGDIVRLLPDRTLGFIGRVDSQIKIRGNRVELGEVESIIRQLPEVDDVTVQVLSYNNSKELVAYVVTSKKFNENKILNYIKKNKPVYMIPSRIIALDKIPLNSNGKVDKKLLPKIRIEKNIDSYDPPTNKIEKLICDTYAKVLNIEQVGINDDFISLGGDSLVAIRLIYYLQKYNISVADIINLRTPKLISNKIEANKALDLDIDKYTIQTGAPLSEQQLNIYLDIAVQQKIESYLINVKINLASYSIDKIYKALDILFEVHPILSAYIDNKRDIPFIKIGKKPSVEIKNTCSEDDISIHLTSPFNLNKNLSRFLISKKDKTLYAVFHHLIFDGLSSSIFIRNLLDILKSRKLQTDTMFLKSSAFSEQIKETELYKSAEVFYEKEFINAEDDINNLVPDIFNDKPSLLNLKINVDNKKLNEFIRKHKISKNILFTGVFAYTLSRFIYSSNAYFAIIDNGRDMLNAFRNIGMFVNTLPIIINCENDLIDNFLKKCEKIMYETVKYSFYPYRLLKKKYNLNNNIIFQYLPSDGAFDKIYQEYKIEDRNDLITELSFELYDIKDSYTLQVTSSSKYSQSTIKKMLSTYERVLNQMLIKKELCDIEYISKEDIKVIKQINNTEKKLKYCDVLEAFNDSLKKWPENILVKYLDTEFTYEQTASWVNSLSKNFKNIQRNSNIAILTHRSHYYLLSALVVLNNGCAYVPIDDAFPDARIKFMLEDTNASALIVTNETYNRSKKIVSKLTSKPLLINISNVEYNTSRKLLNSNFSNSDTGLILYTSGTTGLPKGSLITRKSIINFAEWYVNETNMTQKDCYSMYTVCSFDIHTAAYYAPILVGASLDIVPQEARFNLNYLNSHFNKVHATHTYITSQLGKLYAESEFKTSIKLLCFGGMKLGELNAPDSIGAFESYGPTENLAITTSIYANKRIHSSSIGKFVWNVKGYVLDKELRLVPIGGIGELCVCGHQLSKGYLNRDKDNELAFINNPYSDKKDYDVLYKTGDIVRVLPDNTLGIIGRVDSQVKIRGNRVELGEVESCIKKIKDVKDVVVQVIDNQGNNELVAYVVSNNKQIKELIIEHVEKNKPLFMVPSYVVNLDKIPLNINGKIDTQALPKVDISQSRVEYVAPSNIIEKCLCDAFADIFNLDKVGINDDFLALGGDSIKAIRLIGILNDNNYYIEANKILSLKTPKLIGGVIAKENVVIYKHIEGDVALSPIQKYFFDTVNNKDGLCQFIIVRSNKNLILSKLQKAFNQLVNLQDMLRVKYNDSRQIICPLDSVVFKIIELNNIDKIRTTLKNELSKSIKSISLKNNHLIDIKLINNVYVIFAIHHLLVDGVSWSVLLDNLTKLYNNKKIYRPYPYAFYVKDLDNYSKNINEDIIKKYQHINNLVDEDNIKGKALPINYEFKSNFQASNVYELTEHEFLLLAVARAYKKTYKKDIIFEMESHGRDENIANINHTIGWFTSIYPMYVSVSDSNNSTGVIKDLFEVKKAVQNSRRFGIDYLISCYYLKKIKFNHFPVTFNYLSDEFLFSNSMFKTLDIENVNLSDFNNIDFKQNIYGISLNIQKHKQRYFINGYCAGNTYLSKRYVQFFESIKKESILISKTLKNDVILYPLHEESLGVYLDEKTNDKGSAYSCFSYVKFDKGTSLSFIKDRIYQVLKKHPVLKTRIIEFDDGVYGITDAKVDINVWKINYCDLTIEKFTEKYNFNDSLCHFYIILDKDFTYVAYDIHHMIFDATSRSFLNEELTSNSYIGYDYGFLKKLNYDIKIKHSPLFEEAKDFYDNQFACFDSALEMLLDINSNFGGVASIYLGNIRSKLIDLARKLNITPNTILMCAFAYTLSCFCNSNNCYFVFTSNGRNLDFLNSALGMYVQSIPIIIDTTNQKIDKFLRESFEKLLNSMKYSVYPFRLIAKKFNINQNISFEYNTNLDELSNVSKRISYKKDTKNKNSYVSDLLGVVNDYENGYFFSVEHSSKYFKETAIRFVKTYKKVINDLLTKQYLSQINYSLNEDIKLINKINNNDKKLKYNNILEAFYDSAKKFPNNVLVSYLDNKYTYKQAYIWINNLSEKLKDIPQGSKIAIFTHRSHYYLLCALAVLNCGCAYVPIDDDYPDNRINFILKDSNAKYVLTTSEKIKRLNKLTTIPYFDVSNVSCEKLQKQRKCNTKYNDTAVILYTSGTTGISKGVILPVRAIISFVEWFANETEFLSKDCFAMYCSFGFDVHIESFFVPIIKGGRVSIIPNDIRKDLVSLVKYIDENKVTYIDLPTALTKLLFSFQLPSTLKVLLTGGEPLGNYYKKTNCVFYDTYGPTEATVSVSYVRVKDRIDSSSIGILNSNMKAYILDKEHRRVPFGGVGELYLSGFQLANGYLNRSKENKSSFFNNPFDGDVVGYERMYKTGDIVRYLPDGSLGFIGREDSQVKIRGNRVELGDVEAAIREIDNIQDVTVQIININSVNKLVAYVVSDIDDISSMVKQHIMASRPSYMVPSYVIIVDKIPLNANGKIDINSLSKIKLYDNNVTYVAPTNVLQQIICDSFAKVFNLTKISLNDNFIDLGGDSITAIHISSYILKKGFKISARDIIEYKTPYLISKNINGQKVIKQYKNLNCVVPLGAIQKYFFEEEFSNKNVQYFIVEARSSIDKDKFIKAFSLLIKKHDMLRAKYKKTRNNKIIQYVDKSVNYNYEYINTQSSVDDYITDNIFTWINQIDIFKNRLISLRIIEGKKTLIVFIIHHLLIDGVSWNILLNDLSGIYFSLLDNSNIDLTSCYPYKRWNNDVLRFVNFLKDDEIKFWYKINQKLKDIKNLQGKTINFSIDVQRSFKQNNCFNINEEEYLLLALARAYKLTFKQDIIIEYESHGRLDKLKNIGNTVGWFTSIYPLSVTVEAKNTLNSYLSDICSIRQSLSEIKHLGIEYLVLCYTNNMFTYRHCPVIFNFLDYEFIFENKLFKTPQYNVNINNRLNIKPDNDYCHGLSLDIFNMKSQYFISGQYADGTYLAQSFNKFIQNIKIQLLNIADIAFTNSNAVHISKFQSLNKKSDFKQENYYDFCINYGVKLNNNSRRIADIEFNHPKGRDFSYEIKFDISDDVSVDKIKWIIGELITRHPILNTKIKKYNNEYYLLKSNQVEIYTSDDCDLKQFLSKNLHLENNLSKFYIENKENKIIVYLICHHVICDNFSEKLLYRHFNEILEDKKFQIDYGFIQQLDYESDILDTIIYDKAKSYSLSKFKKLHKQPLLQSTLNESGFYLTQLNISEKELIEILIKYNISEGDFFAGVFGYSLCKYLKVDNTLFFESSHGRDLFNLYDSVGCFAVTLPLFVDINEEMSKFFNRIKMCRHSIQDFGFYPFMEDALNYRKKYELSRFNEFDFHYEPIEKDDSRWSIWKNKKNYISTQITYENTYIPEDTCRVYKINELFYLMLGHNSDISKNDALNFFKEIIKNVKSIVCHTR